MTGLGPSMPDVEDDEVDTGRRLLPLTSAASVHSDEIEDEFLPAVDPRCSQLLIDELEEEEESSSLCKFLALNYFQILRLFSKV